jgi:glutaredoxin
MKINYKVVGIVLVVLILVTVLYRKSNYTESDIKFYGSDECGWCIKQKKYFDDKGITYQYINCKTTECPEFVKSFPTLMVDGKVTSGYQEL